MHSDNTWRARYAERIAAAEALMSRLRYSRSRIWPCQNCVGLALIAAAIIRPLHSDISRPASPVDRSGRPRAKSTAVLWEMRAPVLASSSDPANCSLYVL